MEIKNGQEEEKEEEEEEEEESYESYLTPEGGLVPLSYFEFHGLPLNIYTTVGVRGNYKFMEINGIQGKSM